MSGRRSSRGRTVDAPSKRLKKDLTVPARPDTGTPRAASRKQSELDSLVELVESSSNVFDHLVSAKRTYEVMINEPSAASPTITRNMQTEPAEKNAQEGSIVASAFGYRPITLSYPTTTVQLVCGGVSYPVPKEFLTAVSPCFAAASKVKFSRIEEGEYNLDDVDVRVINTFIEWLYVRGLVRIDGTQFNPSADCRKTVIMQNDLIDLYIFGHQCDIPLLRRDSLNTLAELYHGTGWHLPESSTISDLYDRLPASSPLIRFMVDLYALKWHNLCLPRLREYKLNDFIIDIFEKIGNAPNRRPQHDPRSHLCDYHDHDKANVGTC